MDPGESKVVTADGDVQHQSLLCTDQWEVRTGDILDSVVNTAQQ